MPGLMVRGCLVMKTQEVHAVVVPVRRPNDGMDVKFLGLSVVQHNPFMVIKFNHHHWALNAIIKGALFAHAASPAEMSVEKMPFHVVHSDLEGTRRQRG